MLGLLAPCRHRLGEELAAQWQAHLCGLCLTLRDRHGQLARSLTSTDAVLVSVLVEAQQALDQPTARRTAGPCPLRGMRTAAVVAPSALPARLAATASLTLAAGRAGDVVGEAQHRLAPHTALGGRAAQVVAPRLRARARADAPVAGALGVDGVLDGLAGQAALERAVRPGDDLDAVTEPSAAACAAVFAASADLAGAPRNTQQLSEIGADYGRLAHLLDALADLDEDARRGAFNPVAASGTPPERVRERCRALLARIRRGVDALDLVDDRLVRVLLVDTLRSAVHDVTCSGPVSAPPGRGRRPFWRAVGPWAAVYCTGYACCAEHENPCTGKRHGPACDGADCCDCTGCCDCGDCCGCCDCGCDC